MQRLPVLFGVIIFSFAVLVGVGTSQEGKKDDPKKAKGMLPAGFKDLGLTADQKGKIYSIQAEYKTKTAELEKKLKELRFMESQEIFKVLTDDQREKYLKAKGVETKDKKEATKDKKVGEKDKKTD